jgi:hypothetical protein
MINTINELILTCAMLVNGVMREVVYNNFLVWVIKFNIKQITYLLTKGVP